jgi:hypothetical protein
MNSVSEYGVFTDIVTMSGFLISATSAIALTWKRRAKWEPSEEDLPKGIQKLGGLLGAGGLAVLFARYDTPAAAPALLAVSLWVTLVVVGSFVIYGMLVSIFTYKKLVSRSKNTFEESKIIGGFWLKPAARAQYKDNVTIQMLYAGAAYDEDKVWPRLARALAKQSFNLAYLGITVGGTTALATFALLVRAEISPAEEAAKVGGLLGGRSFEVAAVNPTSRSLALAGPAHELFSEWHGLFSNLRREVNSCMEPLSESLISAKRIYSERRSERM